MIDKTEVSGVGLVAATWLVPTKTLEDIMDCLCEQLSVLRGEKGELEQVMSPAMKKVVKTFGLDVIHNHTEAVLFYLRCLIAVSRPLYDSNENETEEEQHG